MGGWVGGWWVVGGGGGVQTHFSDQPKSRLINLLEILVLAMKGY